ncbi:MAG: hypothetical protein Q7S96_02185 [bacterium]|nr:hypothetical protein [bacterium]
MQHIRTATWLGVLLGVSACASRPQGAITATMPSSASHAPNPLSALDAYIATLREARDPVLLPVADLLEELSAIPNGGTCGTSNGSPTAVAFVGAPDDLLALYASELEVGMHLHPAFRITARRFADALLETCAEQHANDNVDGTHAPRCDALVGLDALGSLRIARASDTYRVDVRIACLHDGIVIAAATSSIPVALLDHLRARIARDATIAGQRQTIQRMLDELRANPDSPHIRALYKRVAERYRQQ